VLNGNDQLIPSKNTWDWLGEGIYFWEQNPSRALEYAIESAERKQFNRIPINTPFVLAAHIQLGHCLNLVESDSLKVLGQAYVGLEQLFKDARQSMPVNKGNNKELDCAVIQYIHQSNVIEGKPMYDTVRCAFQEGKLAYPGATCSSRLHIQVCVINPACITGYFLPRPLEKFNPYLRSFEGAL
jgi:hypothetical protein